MDTLSTHCPPLDALLDGGLESDAITLVFGEGGSGKTNLALQCARSVAAAGRRVAYVDTEGVSRRRLEQVFSALPDDGREAAEDRLLFFQPFTIHEQEQMIQRTALLRDVGLIVVDSINMHYRLHIDTAGGEKEAARSLYGQLHHLTLHARRNHIPVLITGQVYGGEEGTQPFARRVMEHLVKALVRFEKRPDGTRRATVLKHRSIEEGRQARFRIGATGLEALDGATTPGRTAQAPARRPAERERVEQERPPLPDPRAGDDMEDDPEGLEPEVRADAPAPPVVPEVPHAGGDEPPGLPLSDEERREVEGLPGFTTARQLVAAQDGPTDRRARASEGGRDADGDGSGEGPPPA